MKKNAKVEIDSKWWAKNKAKTLKYKGFDTALLKYEMARDALDYKKMAKELDKLEKERKACITECSGFRHADTIAGLKRYEAAIKAEKAKIKADEKEYDKNQAKQAAAGQGGAAQAPQKMKKSVVIWKKDIGPDVFKRTKDIAFKQWRCEFSLKLNEDILITLENEEDYVTPAFMVEDAQDIAEKATDTITKIAENIGKLSIGRDRTFRDNLIKTSNAKIKAVADKAAKDIGNVPKARWAKFAAKKKQYKTYKIKCAAEVMVSTVTVTTTVTGAVLSGGALGPVAIIGIIRNTYAIGKQIYDLGLSANKAAKNFETNIATVKKQYMDSDKEIKKTKMRAKEFAGTTMKVLLGSDVPFMATLPKCEASLDLWDNKVAGVSTKLPKLSKSLMKAMKATEGLEKELKTIKGKDAIKTYKKVVKAREALSAAFDKCADTAGQVRKFDRESPAFKADLKKLKEANGKGLEYYDKIGPIISNIAVSAGGFGELTDSLEGMKATLEIINVAESTIGTVEGEVLNLL